MKKIMFDDHFGLTQAVLEGRKTMTRRIVSEKLLQRAHDYMNSVHGTGLDMHEYIFHHSTYKAFEVVAVAERYKILPLAAKAGYRNKMFVRADLMPHQIRITSARIERLQDISNEDCMREGVRKLESENCPTMFTFDGWSFKNKVNRCTDSPKEAFEALFKKLSGKKAWDDNPWVFVYEFELVK